MGVMLLELHLQKHLECDITMKHQNCYNDHVRFDLCRAKVHFFNEAKTPAWHVQSQILFLHNFCHAFQRWHHVSSSQMLSCQISSQIASGKCFQRVVEGSTKILHLSVLQPRLPNQGQSNVSQFFLDFHDLSNVAQS